MLDTCELTGVLVTERLHARSQRCPDYRMEATSLHKLLRSMADDPSNGLQKVVDLALEVCRAGTGGISLLEKQPNGTTLFRWTHLSGELKRFVGGSTPRNHSPCGVTLNAGRPQLFYWPGRYFEYFREVDPPIVEGLVVPIVAIGRHLGTLWVVSHNEDEGFDMEDARIMGALANFAALAHLLWARTCSGQPATSTAR